MGADTAPSPMTLAEQAGPDCTENVSLALAGVADYFGRIQRRWLPDEPGSLRYLEDKACQLVDAAERLERALSVARRNAEARLDDDGR